jgi:hypothetical protein
LGSRRRAEGDRWRRRLKIEEPGEGEDPRDAIDDTVVDLGNDRELSFVEALD